MEASPLDRELIKLLESCVDTQIAFKNLKQRLSYIRTSKPLEMLENFPHHDITVSRAKLRMRDQIGISGFSDTFTAYYLSNYVLTYTTELELTKGIDHDLDLDDLLLDQFEACLGFDFPYEMSLMNSPIDLVKDDSIIKGYVGAVALLSEFKINLTDIGNLDTLRIQINEMEPKEVFQLTGNGQILQPMTNMVELFLASNSPDLKYLTKEYLDLAMLIQYKIKDLLPPFLYQVSYFFAGI